MIVVLADDISGAAELAGIACSLELSAEVQTRFDPNSSANVVAVDSDTRSLNETDAVNRVSEIAAQIAAARPDWIYKKTDSVLRGHIRAEITALLRATQKGQCLFIPANPSRKRTISGGRYFVDGRPLHETVFASDPEYPARCCEVRALLERGTGAPVSILGEHNAQSRENEIIVPDVSSTAELHQQATSAGEDSLCAGAADFFRALLETHTGIKELKEGTSFRLPETPLMYVCGSVAAWPVRREQCSREGIPIYEAPLIADEGGEPVAAWTNKVLQDLRQHKRALVGIGEPALASQIPPTMLVELFARAIKPIIEAGHLKTILLEGGATAITVLRAMNWDRLVAVTPFGAGIPALQVHGCDQLVLGIKPGSYPWPAEWWEHKNL